jgi:SAM-dependent methyltransferase
MAAAAGAVVYCFFQQHLSGRRASKQATMVLLLLLRRLLTSSSFQLSALVGVSLCLLSLWPHRTTSSAADGQWLFQSESKWDKEWKSGSWDYLETVACERSRIAVIGGVLVPMYSHANASVLDIGCGEGPIADFLTADQRSKYVGVDISKEAIHSAKRKRGPPLKFVHATAHEFTPQHKFDVVIFSDVLYYVEYEKVLKQYEGYLLPRGIIIISIFHQSEKLMYENIFKFARSSFEFLDEMEVSGFTKKNKGLNLEKTAFHIEVYRRK